jgi:hypothetical protein
MITEACRSTSRRAVVSSRLSSTPTPSMSTVTFLPIAYPPLSSVVAKALSPGNLVSGKREHDPVQRNAIRDWGRAWPCGTERDCARAIDGTSSIAVAPPTNRRRLRTRPA